MKFGRTYKMRIDGQLFTWTPTFPTTLEFDINRSTFASANKATFTIYNLQMAARRDIYFDRFINNQRLKCTLQAGYVSSPVLPTIFQGDVRVAWTERRGRDWITQVECFDGGFALYNAFAGFTLPPGYTMKTAAAALVATMKPLGVTLGQVSNINLPNEETGIVFPGNAWDELQKLVPGEGQLFIDNGVCHILNPQDFLPTPTIPIISPQTGLIGTPRKQGNLVTVRMMFDPQYIVGQLVALQSLEPWLNSPKLKVVGLHHFGKISGVEGGDLITELQLFAGYDNQELVPVDAAFEGQFA
jgi:hypothetical protein